MKQLSMDELYWIVESLDYSIDRIRSGQLDYEIKCKKIEKLRITKTKIQDEIKNRRHE